MVYRRWIRGESDVQKKSLLWEVLFFVTCGIGLIVGDVRRLVRRVEWSILQRHLHRNPRIIKLLYLLSFEEFRKHKQVNAVSFTLMYGPGKCEITNRMVCWETPLGIAIWDKQSPLLALGVEIKHNMLCIRQLQGIPGKRLPEEMRDWPKRFVRLAIRFARLSGLKGVRLYRAHTSVFYWAPELQVPEGMTRKEALDAHRQRMRRRYDGTARQMGFVMKKDYGEWLCPPRAPGPS